MFLASELADWLENAGIEANFYFEGQALADIEQDVAVIIAKRGGGPTILERTFDRPTVQVTVRGPQNDPEAAESLAMAIDDALMTPAITTIGTTRVISIDRLGGDPASGPRDSARRDTFTCSYTFQAARTIF